MRIRNGIIVEMESAKIYGYFQALKIEMSVKFSRKEGVRIMRIQRNTMLMFLSVMFVLVLIIKPAGAHFGDCVHQPDGPDCPCFVDAGAWDPAGAFIQDVAIQTLGTIESCECPGIFGCGWPFPRQEKKMSPPSLITRWYLGPTICHWQSWRQWS